MKARIKSHFFRAAAVVFSVFTAVGINSSHALAQSAPEPVVAPLSGVSRSGGITEKMRREDARLLARVSLRAPSLYVGELLEILTAQTGVALSANDRDGAAGERVAVFFQEVPLGEALDTLWSLLSYQKGERLWEREEIKSTATPGKAPSAPPVYRYLFVRPAAVDTLAVTVKQSIQQDFEAETERRLNALDLSPAELKAASKRDPRLKDMSDSDVLRSGLAALRSLPVEMRQAALRCRERIYVPIRQIPESGRAFAAQSRLSSLRVAPPESTQIDLERRFGLGRNTPVLQISDGETGTYVIVGGDLMENRWRANLNDLWLLPGDTATDSVRESRTIPAPPAAASVPDSESSRTALLGRRLAQMTAAAPSLSVLARYPQRRIAIRWDDVGAPYNQRLDTILERFSRFNQPHKWRHGMLLIGSHYWLNNVNAETQQDQDHRIPWSLVKRLRAEEAANGGFLTVDTLIWAAANLTEDERDRLAFEEFPGLQGDGYPPEVQKLLQYLGQERKDYRIQIRSARGLSIQRLSPELEKNLQDIAQLNKVSDPVVAIRLEEGAADEKRGTVLDKDAPVRFVRFVLLGRTGTILDTGDALKLTYTGRTTRRPDAKIVP